MSRTIQQCGKHDDPQQNPKGQNHPHRDQQPPVYAHLVITLKGPDAREPSPRQYQFGIDPNKNALPPITPDIRS
jgi:hypothetical protein